MEKQYESEEEDLKSLTHSTTNIKDQVAEVSPSGKFYRFNEELGSGAFKRVYRGLNNDLGCEVAWSVISMKNLPREERAKISEEVKLNRKLNHPNIIYFITAWTNPEKDELVFITEIFTGGSLRQYLKRIKQPRLKVIKMWCRKILSGLQYLHSQQPYPIIHRDLKCDNIFVMANNGDIKIGDFGLSTLMRNSLATSVLGTPEYMAPELYEGSYDIKVDIYAFGMCVLEMVTQRKPYRECSTPAAIYKHVLSRKVPAAIYQIQDSEVRDFILLCLGEHSTRPTAAELANHPFLVIDENDHRNHQPVPFTSLNVELSSGPSSPCKRVVQMSLVIRNGTGNTQEVTFDYSIQEDTPEGVSEEMVKELGLGEALKIEIAREIEIRLASNTASPKQRPKNFPPLSFKEVGPSPFILDASDKRKIRPVKTDDDLFLRNKFAEESFDFTTPLQRGAISNSRAAVIAVQKLLSQITGEKLSCNGFFGTVLEELVIDFQIQAGLVPDGIVTDMVWEAMNQVSENSVKIPNIH